MQQDLCYFLKTIPLPVTECCDETNVGKKVDAVTCLVSLIAGVLESIGCSFFCWTIFACNHCYHCAESKWVYRVAKK